MQSESVKYFIRQVCGQVKAKWAHNLIGYELAAHIEDQKSAYIKAGMDELTAELKAIEQMGEPFIIAEEYDKIHRVKPGLIPEVIMWVFAGSITLAGITAGIILFAMMFLAGNDTIAFAAFIAGGTCIIFGVLLGFMVLTVWKVAADTIFGYMLVRDYRRRRNKFKNKINRKR